MFKKKPTQQKSSNLLEQCP